MKVPWYSPNSFLIFCLLRSNGKKNTWMRTIFVMVMVIISKVQFWKLLDIGCFQSSQQLRFTLTNDIWKTPYSWRFYRHGPTYVSILSWINIMKQKSAKVPWKLLVAQKSDPVLWRTFARHFTHYYGLFFSLKQT